MKNIKGIACMLMHCIIISILFVLGRIHQESVDTTMMVMMYSVTTIPMVGIIILLKNPNLFYTKKTIWHFWRGVLQSIGFISYFYGLARIEIGLATAISFLTPIISSVMASFVFKQTLSSRQIAMLVIGFIGILIIINPTVSLNNGIIFIIISTLSWAICDMVTIKIGKKENMLTQLFYLNLFSIIFCSITMPGNLPSVFDSSHYTILTIIMAILYMFQTVFIGTAIQTTPLQYIMPIDYLRLPISATIGMWLFHETLGFNVYIGGLIVAISSMITMIPESHYVSVNGNEEEKSSL